jgi:hypothetical protein
MLSKTAQYVARTHSHLAKTSIFSACNSQIYLRF